MEYARIISETHNEENRNRKRNSSIRKPPYQLIIKVKRRNYAYFANSNRVCSVRDVCCEVSADNNNACDRLEDANHRVSWALPDSDWVKF